MIRIELELYSPRPDFNHSSDMFRTDTSRENASAWLQYHLGQSTGYRDLSRRLQKRITDPSPIQPNYHVIAEYQSLAPLSPRGVRRSRVSSGSHVISPGDFFWLQRDPLNSFGVTSAPFRKSRDNTSANDGLSELQLRGCSPFTSGSRACKSAGSRLLGTTRSEPNCASATRRTSRLNRKHDTDGNMAAELMLLDPVTAPSKDASIGLAKVSYDGPRDAATIHNYITSAKHGQHDVIINYHVGASPITRSRSEFFTRTIVPREDNSKRLDAPPSSPIQSKTDHVTQPQPIIDEETPAEENSNHTSDMTSPSLDRLNPDPTEGSSPEQTTASGKDRKNVTDLTISEYFYVTLDDDAAHNGSSPSNSKTDDVKCSEQPLSELVQRPNTKRSVRFSVENDVYRYSPWEPISCS